IPICATFIFFFISGVVLEETTTASGENFTFNPCCSFPCHHSGVCIQISSHTYECDCTNTGYYGKDCNKPYFRKKFDEMFTFPFNYKDYYLCGEPLVWSIVNHIEDLHGEVLKLFYSAGGSESKINPARYNSKYDYITADSHFDFSSIARILPQVPINCPTPMGVLGPKVYPDEGEIFHKLFLRRRFKPDPHGTNLLFLAFLEHLTFTLIKRDEPDGYNFSKFPFEFDSDHIYGKDDETRRELRTLQGGRLKTSSINDEIYPPLQLSSVVVPQTQSEKSLEEDPCNTLLELGLGDTGLINATVKGCLADVDMEYPPETKGLRFALAHPKLAKTPFLLMLSTIWIREHNRVAHLIAIEHPDWDDERLYQVTRLIITGELIHITVTDFLKQLTQYNLDIVWNPNVLDEKIMAERISIEIQQLQHWHAMIPDCIKIGNSTLNYTETFYNNEILTKFGVDYIIDILSRDTAGKVTYRNYAESMRKTVIDTILKGRKNRLQSFNSYRKNYGLEPYRSMFELCGDEKLAASLDKFYGDINAIEFFVGLAVETHRCSVFPPTQMAIGGPYIMKSIFSSPLNSPQWWKSSTFGGELGFKIVSEVTLRGLFCQNMKNRCKGEEYVSFHIQSEKELMEEAERKRQRLWCLDEDEIGLF
ncbi:hypothetical protein J437_LFUL002455, partial [Ladona fulva]